MGILPQPNRSVLRSRAAALVALSLPLLLEACRHTPTPGQLVNERQTAAYRQPGRAVIQGQVILVRPGHTVYGSSCAVRLTPVTAQSTTYYEKVVLPGEASLQKIESGDISWLKTADDYGRFRFDDLPGGEYFVFCPIAWMEDGKARNAIAWARTSVGAGQTVHVTVTR